MNTIIIESKKKKYIKKSFLNYSKKQLIENFKHEIINEELEKANYLLFDMINSGFFKDIWTIYFTIYSEYIHILNPFILNTIHINYKRFQEMLKKARTSNLHILDARNSFNFRKILFMILKKLIKTPKKHLGYIIPQSFNNQNKLTSHTPLLNIFDSKNIPNLGLLKEVINNQDYKDVEHALKEFHHHIEYSIHKKFTFNQQQLEIKETCFFWLAKILVIGAENTNIIGYPYNISLYHTIDQNSKNSFTPIIWNMLLNGSKKLGRDYFNHVIILYKIYNSNILQKIKRENFLIIQAVLFFFEHILWNAPQVNLLDDDYKNIDSIYTEYDIEIQNQKIQIQKKPKLKSIEIINKNKNDIDKLIEKRKTDINDILPPKPDKYHFIPMSPVDVEIEKQKEKFKKKLKKKKKRNKKEPDLDYKLPEVFYNFHNPSKNDIKVTNFINNLKNKPIIPLVKPIIVSESTKRKNMKNIIVTKN